MMKDFFAYMPEIPNEINLMPPLSPPIGTATVPPMPENIRKWPNGKTELDTAPGWFKVYPRDDVLDYLEHLDYGTYIKIYHDCEDRAFWGMAHARHRFPGLPIGVASGEAVEGPIADLQDRRHAVIVLWYQGDRELEPLYWDPIPEHQGTVEFAEIRSIVAYPIGSGPYIAKPLDSFTPLDNQALVYDERRIIYRKSDILSYLNNEILHERGEHVCGEDHTTPYLESLRDKWRDYDAALWAFAHVRRAYVGCPIGVAIRDPTIGDASDTAIILWHKTDESKENSDLTYTYLDPKGIGKIEDDPKPASLKEIPRSEFTPKVIFV